MPRRERWSSHPDPARSLALLLEQVYPAVNAGWSLRHEGFNRTNHRCWRRYVRWARKLACTPCGTWPTSAGSRYRIVDYGGKEALKGSERLLSPLTARESPSTTQRGFRAARWIPLEEAGDAVGRMSKPYPDHARDAVAWRHEAGLEYSDTPAEVVARISQVTTAPAEYTGVGLGHAGSAARENDVLRTASRRPEPGSGLGVTAARHSLSLLSTAVRLIARAIDPRSSGRLSSVAQSPEAVVSGNEAEQLVQAVCVARASSAVRPTSRRRRGPQVVRGEELNGCTGRPQRRRHASTNSGDKALVGSTFAVAHHVRICTYSYTEGTIDWNPVTVGRYSQVAVAGVLADRNPGTCCPRRRDGVHDVHRLRRGKGDQRVQGGSSLQQRPGMRRFAFNLSAGQVEPAIDQVTCRSAAPSARCCPPAATVT